MDYQQLTKGSYLASEIEKTKSRIIACEDSAGKDLILEYKFSDGSVEREIVLHGSDELDGVLKIVKEINEKKLAAYEKDFKEL